MGIIQVSGEAAAAGIGSVPKPSSDIGSPWAWWHTSIVGEQVANEVDNNGKTIDRFEVDSKAMRKLDHNSVLIFVTESVNCILTIDAAICGSCRILLKLS